MPVTDTSLYRTQDEILADMLAQLLAGIPDAYTGEDGIISIVLTIEAAQLENLYLAHQLLLEDMFITTASLQALIQYGEQYGIAPNLGDQSTGTLQFSGDANTYIPVGAEVGYDPGGGLDVIYFNTITDGTIPNPGTPTAPTVAIDAAAGNLNGLYEYMVTFVNAVGETLPSPFTAAVNPVNKQVDLSVIPIGGVGTTQRKIYRDKNGANTPRLVATIANNTTTTLVDNVTDAVAATGALAPTVDTAHSVVVNGEAEDPGSDGNVGVAVITELTNAPTGLVSVMNPIAFTGGTEPEDTEAFRQRLLSFVQNPQTGSPADLVEWAEAVDGVESATVFPNTPAAGSVTVRITGTGGSVPSAAVVTAVQNALIAQDLANVTIIVSTFTSVSTNVTVQTVLDPAYILTDVQPAAVTAITNYINGLDVGATMYLSGIIDAVFGIPGILDLTVTTPTTNQTTPATSKRVAGTITVN